MKRRIFCADGIMHVYQRTLHGFNLFYSVEDFLVFYTIVSVQAKKIRICLLGMCLMIDHVHLLLSTDSLKQMSMFISAYTSLYAREFNARTGRQGPFFESPYGSAVKLSLKKIRSAIAYLFNNPVEKKLCKKAEHYKWNFLSYYENATRINKSSCSKKLRRSMDIVQYSCKSGRYLNHTLIENIIKELKADEKEMLISYIICTYFPFDKQRFINYYGSYDMMLIAINSNTGSEYEIAETSWCKSDRPYREIISYLKKAGHGDMHAMITLSLEDKINILKQLKEHTSASNIQIMKFLHILGEDLTLKALSVNPLNKRG